MSCRSVHKVKVKLPPPSTISTPYGGRLEYKLKCDTKLVVHLKDNAKIRNRKRWSQVAYAKTTACVQYC